MPDASHCLPAQPRKVYIYALADETGIRYVGQGMVPGKRFLEHQKDKKTSPKTAWLRALLAAGKKPMLLILEETDAEHCNDLEVAWIAYGRANGWELTNSTAGGSGAKGYKHTAEARRNMGVAKLGNNWNVGRWVGRPISEKQKRQISSKLMGHIQNAETIRKRAEAGRGRVQSAATRQKLSDFHTGKVMSVEARQKMSEAKKGRLPWNAGRKTGPLPASTRAKLSEAMRAYRRQQRLDDAATQP